MTGLVQGVHYAHRAAWVLFKGPIPLGLQVLHSCDNSSCVNPDHLWLGTNDDNVVDKMNKGRHRSNSAALRAFSDEEVQAIREEHASGLSYRKIAQKRGTGAFVVLCAVRGLQAYSRS